MSDLTRGLQALADSAEAYREAESYYDGTVKEYFSSAKIAKAISKSGSSFKLTFSAVPVDARVDRMELASMTVPGSTTLTALLTEKFVEENDLDEDLDDYLRKAAYFGDYYMTVWEGDEDDDEAGNSTVTSVEVFGNSPLAMRTIYSRENSRIGLYTIKLWEADDSTKNEPRWRVNLYYRDRIEQYISKKDQGSGGIDEGSWEPLYEYDDDDQPIEDSWQIENPYGKLPTFHFRQGSKPYGEPVHKRAWGAQDAINKLNITHMSTVEISGYPQRWALVDAAAGDADTGDDFIEFDTSGVGVGDPASTAVTDLTRSKSKLKSGPGETWWLTGVKNVGQFEPAKPEIFMTPLAFQIRAMAVLSKTSLYEFDPTGVTPSGESRRRADAPLAKDVRTILRGHGRTLENAASFALEILGHANQKVEVKWKATEIATAKEDWEVIGEKLSNGVPLRVVLSEAGYSEEELAEWYPEGLPALAPATLVELGGALGSFGQAATLGSIDAEAVRAAFPMLYVDDRATEPEVDPDALEDPNIVVPVDVEDPELTEARILREKAETLGILVRAGASQETAAAELGLEGLEFTAIPTTVRLSEADAAELEPASG